MDPSLNATIMNINIIPIVSPIPIPVPRLIPLQIFDNILLDRSQHMQQLDHHFSVINRMQMPNINMQMLPNHITNSNFFYNENDDEDDYFNEFTNTIFNIPSFRPQMNQIISQVGGLQTRPDSSDNIPPNFNLFTPNAFDLDRILNESFANDEPAYKVVLSDKGKKQLEYLKYTTTKELTGTGDSDKYNTECPITLVEFEEGADIIRLPCKHCFSKNTIETWLNDKPECPVCRFKLDSVEVKKSSTSTSEAATSIEDDVPNPSQNPNPFIGEGIQYMMRNAILNNFEYNDNDELENNDIDPDTEYLIATLINYFDALDVSSSSTN